MHVRKPYFMKNINITNPCSENWEMMSHQEKGRFCEVCSMCEDVRNKKNLLISQQVF